jgi:hypothetical protein
MKTKKEKILAALAAGQDAATVAKKFGVSKSYVYVTRWKANKKKPAKKKAGKKENRIEWKPLETKLESIRESGEMFKWVDLPAEAEIPQTDKKIDPVNSPPHYTAGGIETIDFIEAKDLNYRLGNVVKYLSRAGKKVDGDPITDLEKAKWYLDREIATRKGA